MNVSGNERGTQNKKQRKSINGQIEQDALLIDYIIVFKNNPF